MSAKKVGAILVVLIVLYSLWNALGSSASSVSADKSELIFDTVIRGNLVLDVRAPGTLQPVQLRWIAASSAGRVEQIFIQPGAEVEPDTVILTLSNPTLARDVETAAFGLQVAEAELVALQKRLESDYLTQQAVVAEFESNYQNATFRVGANEALADKQIVSQLDVKETQLLQQQYANRLHIEKQRLTHLKTLHQAEIEAKQAQLNQAKSQLRLQEALLDNLQVKAGLKGILQQVPVEQGQQINEGEVLANVARVDNLKAELKVQESQVSRVQLGQKVTISAGGQQTLGKVQRIEPAVIEGVVIVDIQIDGEALPNGRPDLRVEGVIEIDRLENILLVKRPVYSKENASTQLYLVDESGNSAALTAIRLGSASLDKIQIKSGLKMGDRIIVSDTRQFQQQPQIALQ